MSGARAASHFAAKALPEMDVCHAGINNRCHKRAAGTVYGLSCNVGASVRMNRMDSSSGKMAQMFELDAYAAVIPKWRLPFWWTWQYLGRLLAPLLISSIRYGMNLMEILQFKQMMSTTFAVALTVWIDVIRRQRLLRK